MTYKKASEVDFWLSKPDLAKITVLFYGPNYGLVCERAEHFILSRGLDIKDPFSVVRLDANEANKSGFVLEEAQSLSFFAKKRLLWIRHANTQKGICDAIQALEHSSPPNITIVIEAGDLKKNSSLRGIVEKAEKAIALPCYPDTAYDIASLIKEELQDKNLLVSKEAHTWIQQNLGGDRRVNRNELQKLKLYGHTKNTLELQDVMPLLSDTMHLLIDDLVDSLLCRDIQKFDAFYENFIRGGGVPFFLISAVMRQFQTLHAMRKDLEKRKKKSEEIIGNAKPPLFFMRKKIMSKALQSWRLVEIEAVLKKLQYTVLEMRQTSRLSESIAANILLCIASGERFS